MTTVFLTGASGFLGGHLLRELRSAGCEVKALSRRAETDAAIAAQGGIPVRGALGDVASLRVAIAGCAAVFHAAADTSMWRSRRAEQTATNVEGTENLLRAAEAAQVHAFVHTSSVSAYSHQVHGTLNESVAQQGATSWINYERTKYLGEEAVRRSELPWIVFNPSHILGPGDRHNWARLIMMVDREELPGIPPGSGAFADVRQIAAAQVRGWQRQRFGEAFLLGGEHASFLDLVHRVGTALGKRTPRKATPAWALMAFARLTDAVSRLTGKEPDVTPEGVIDLSCIAGGFGQGATRTRLRRNAVGHVAHRHLGLVARRATGEQLSHRAEPRPRGPVSRRGNLSSPHERCATTRRPIGHVPPKTSQPTPS